MNTGNVTFETTTLAPIGNRTVGDNSRFAPVTRADVEDVLLPLGFQPIIVAGTRELVFARIVNRLSLRVPTGVNADGTARERGKDAIRTQLWARGKDGDPIRIRSAKRTMRVHTWRKNLLRKIAELTVWAENRPAAVPARANPPCPACGGPTTDAKQGRRGRFHGCLAFPVCRGAVDA